MSDRGSRGATALLAALLCTVLAACGGGASNGSLQVPTPNALTTDDVKQIIAQAVFEAQAQNAQATIGVIDRVGNVLAIFKMNGAAPTFTINGETGAVGGLEGVSILPPNMRWFQKRLQPPTFRPRAMRSAHAPPGR